MSIFEILMLACFGAAWPLSILKSYRARSNRGKSARFLIVILTGYVAGTLHKLFFNCDGVIFLYMLNGLIVAVDLGLYVRNRQYDLAAVKQSA